MVNLPNISYFISKHWFYLLFARTVLDVEDLSLTYVLYPWGGHSLEG